MDFLSLIPGILNGVLAFLLIKTWLPRRELKRSEEILRDRMSYAYQVKEELREALRRIERRQQYPVPPGWECPVCGSHDIEVIYKEGQPRSVRQCFSCNEDKAREIWAAFLERHPNISENDIQA